MFRSRKSNNHQCNYTKTISRLRRLIVKYSPGKRLPLFTTINRQSRWTTSSETQGQLVGSIKCSWWKFTVRSRRAPGHFTLTEPVRAAFELPASDWPKKIFLANQRREAAGWLSCFDYTKDNFLAVLPAQTNLDKLSVLENFVSPSIFRHIEECTDYGAGVGILQALFVKPRNEIFARHILATRCQQPQESKRWMKSFKLWKHLARTATSKVSPLLNIPKKASGTLLLLGYGHLRWRQRLLENNTLDLKTMFGQARSLELPMRNSESYSS